MKRPSKSTVVEASLLEAALEGLELQKARIEQQIADVRRRLGKGSPKAAPQKTTSAAPARAKRVLSPAARKRIAAAQKKRWAEFRKKGDA